MANIMLLTRATEVKYFNRSIACPAYSAYSERFSASSESGANSSDQRGQHSSTKRPAMYISMSSGPKRITCGIRSAYSSWRAGSYTKAFNADAATAVAFIITRAV